MITENAAAADIQYTARTAEALFSETAVHKLRVTYGQAAWTIGAVSGSGQGSSGGDLIILFDNMSMVLLLQYGNQLIIFLPILLLKFPPLPESPHCPYLLAAAASSRG